MNSLNPVRLLQSSQMGNEHSIMDTDDEGPFIQVYDDDASTQVNGDYPVNELEGDGPDVNTNASNREHDAPNADRDAADIIGDFNEQRRSRKRAYPFGLDPELHDYDYDTIVSQAKKFKNRAPKSVPAMPKQHERETNRRAECMMPVHYDLLPSGLVRNSNLSAWIPVSLKVFRHLCMD